MNVKKFRTMGTRYRLQFTNAFADKEFFEYHDQLHEIFQSLLDKVTRDVSPVDQELEKPISFSVYATAAFNDCRVLAKFEKVIQSNRDFRLNDSVSVDVTTVEMPHGGKVTKRANINLEKHLTKKRSIILIQNKDELCLARASIVARAKIDNDPQYMSIVNHTRAMQTRLARELHQKASVPLGSCSMEEVKQFQSYLSEYQINIVSKEHQNAMIYVGPEQEKRIYLYLHVNHYDVITTMLGFFARSYCHTCKKGYDHQEAHLCPNVCRCCRFPDCPIVAWICCDDCNRLFKSQACFDRHKQSS